MSGITMRHQYLRSLIAALLVALAVVLGGCDAAQRVQSAPAPTPTYDPFQRHGCTSCDLQQQRVQATMTTSNNP